jgi:hypothetical protein
MKQRAEQIKFMKRLSTTFAAKKFRGRSPAGTADKMSAGKRFAHRDKLPAVPKKNSPSVSLHGQSGGRHARSPVESARAVLFAPT